MIRSVQSKEDIEKIRMNLWTSVYLHTKSHKTGYAAESEANAAVDEFDKKFKTGDK